MISVQKTFPETDYETLEAAVAARDAQAARLQAQGIRCRRETLYRATDGRCVFVITVEEDLLEGNPRHTAPQKPQTRHSRPQKRRARAEQVDFR